MHVTLPELPPETADPSWRRVGDERRPKPAVDLSPRLESILESLLFAADKPLSLAQLAQLVGESDVAKVRAGGGGDRGARAVARHAAPGDRRRLSVSHPSR